MSFNFFSKIIFFQDLSNVWKNVSSQIITDNNLIPAGPYRVPDSCCVFLSDFCGITNATAENIFTDGCADTLKFRIKSYFFGLKFENNFW